MDWSKQTNPFFIFQNTHKIYKMPILKFKIE